MSKLDIGVGDEFPLDETGGDRGRGFRGHRHRHHHHGHHDHFHGHHRHHRRHGLPRLASLLVLAGVIGLIVEHQFTAAMGYGLIGTGLALIVLTALLRAVFHWQFHRRIDRQVP